MLGIRHGIEGLLAGDLVDLGRQTESFYQRLASTPSAVLGSCRYRLQPGDAERAIETLRSQNAHYLIYIGGNDSADTSHQMVQASRGAGLDLSVIGVPKTIDNDLPETDHCPGYGSAARFVAQCTREAGLDTAAMRRTDPIKLIEVMGRHAGWLAAAAWLARRDDRDAPHLVLLPERPQTTTTVLTAVEGVYRRLGHCLIVLCENQPDQDGQVLGASSSPRWTDSFGHQYHESPGQYLADQISEKLGVRARLDKPGTIQRMSAAHHSAVDLAEAEVVGRAAVKLATAGETDVMVTLVRQSDEPYRCATGTARLSAIANRQRLIPDEFIAADGLGLTPAFARYAEPLIGDPLPTPARLS